MIELIEEMNIASNLKETLDEEVDDDRSSDFKDGMMEGSKLTHAVIVQSLRMLDALVKEFE